MSPGKKALLIGLTLFLVGLGILVVTLVALIIMLWLGLTAPTFSPSSLSNNIGLYWGVLVPTLVTGAIIALVGWHVGQETSPEERRTTIRKTLIGSVLIVTVALAAYGTWVVVTPKWAFKVTTDKSSYALGENVIITVTLENLGYIPHSITSSITNAIYVSITEWPYWPVWYSTYEVNKTTFTVAPGHPLTRTIVWNQTNTENPSLWTNRTCNPGTYSIDAWIPDLRDGNAVDPIMAYPLFGGGILINITAT